MYECIHYREIFEEGKWVCKDCKEPIKDTRVIPGGINHTRQKRFQFQCPDRKCVGKFGFALKMKDVPELVPESVVCPFCATMEAFWCMDIAGNFIVVGAGNPYYNKTMADAEHKWLGLQVDETRKAVRGEDQLTGTAASPYSRIEINHEAMVELGRARKVDSETARQRNEILEARSQELARLSLDQLSDLQVQHAVKTDNLYE